ncbi:hypothetical protein [Paeniglutamicibacter sp.]|uniref:hypothetical protein n=1 Tax=Paeniglutamicibacter sp. TaxID=1934391 RepID=UPI003989E3E2
MRDLKGRGIKVRLSTYLRAMMPLRSSIPGAAALARAGCSMPRSPAMKALRRAELEQHPHSWVLDGAKDVPGVLESALVSH